MCLKKEYGFKPVGFVWFKPVGLHESTLFGKGGEREEKREEKGREGNKRLWQKNFLGSLELNIAQV